MKGVLVLAAALLIIPVIAHAQEVQNLVLGISPANAQACLAAGDSAAVRFMVSSNVDVPQNVSVLPINLAWLNTERFIYFSSTYDLYVNISVPPGTNEGEYRATFLVCLVPEGGNMDATEASSCLAPYVNVKVDKTCISKENGMQAEYTRYLLYGALVVSVAFVIWQVSNIMNAGKKRKRGKNA